MLAERSVDACTSETRSGTEGTVSMEKRKECFWCWIARSSAPWERLLLFAYLHLKFIFHLYSFRQKNSSTYYGRKIAYSYKAHGRWPVSIYLTRQKFRFKLFAAMKFRFRPEADIAESFRLGQPRPHTCTVEYKDAVYSVSPWDSEFSSWCLFSKETNATS